MLARSLKNVWWPTTSKWKSSPRWREIEARRKGVYVMDDDERAAVREGQEQAKRGEFVPDDEMDAFWRRIGVL